MSLNCNSIYHIDDDILADRKLISTYVKVFSENKNISGVAGQVLLIDGIAKHKKFYYANRIYIT